MFLVAVQCDLASTMEDDEQEHITSCGTKRTISTGNEKRQPISFWSSYLSVDVVSVTKWNMIVFGSAGFPTSSLDEGA